MIVKNSKYFRLFSVTIISVIAYLLYLHALNGPFLLDDFENIPQTNLVSYDLKSIIFAMIDNKSGFYGRPIPILSFIFNHAFFGPEALSFKVTNLIIHVLCAWLLLELTSTILLSLEYSVKDARIIGFIVAIIWLVHPLQVSTVAYVVQRMTQLVTLFSISSILVYSRARYIQQYTKSTYCWRYLLVVIFLFLAILCKETGFLICVYLLITELTIFRLRTTTKRQKKILIRFLTLFSVIPIIIGTVLFMYIHDTILAGYQYREFDLIQRILTQITGITHYLNLMVLPNIDSMNLYNDAFLVRTSIDEHVFFSMCVITLLICAAVLLSRINPLFCLGILIFVSSHLLESTVIPLEMVFEHRNYFSLYGIILSCLSIVLILSKNMKEKFLILISASIVFCIFSFQTYARSFQWSNEFLHNIISANNAPESTRAKTALVASLLKLERYTEATDIVNILINRESENPFFYLLLLQIECLTNQEKGVDKDELNRLLRASKYRKMNAHAVGKYHLAVENSNCKQSMTDDVKQMYESVLLYSHNTSESEKLNVSVANLAAIYHSEGRISDALKLLESFEIHESGNPELLVRMAWLYALNKQEKLSRNILDSLRSMRVVKYGVFDKEINMVRGILSSK